LRRDLRTKRRNRAQCNPRFDRDHIFGGDFWGITRIRASFTIRRPRASRVRLGDVVVKTDLDFVCSDGLARLALRVGCPFLARNLFVDRQLR
jgi:hypothetical protein